MNVSVTGPYVKKLSRTKDGRKAYFSIRQNFMGDNLINTVKDKAYSTMEAAKYRGESQRFTYKTYVIILRRICVLYPRIMRKFGMLEQVRSYCRPSNVPGLYQVKVL